MVPDIIKSITFGTAGIFNMQPTTIYHMSHVELLSKMRNAIKQTVPDRRIAVAFSGGVDSALLTRLCTDAGYDLTLLTVGFEGSHDILFAEKMAGVTGHDHRILYIHQDDLARTVARVRPQLKVDSMSWLENCIAFCYIAELAGDTTVVTANGIDELFCGYDIYRREFAAGYNRLEQIMCQKIQNELQMIDAIGGIAQIKTVQPFLTSDFVAYARTVPISEKITGTGDLLRKHIVRRAALHAGVPEISAYKRKKALQYGSGIHRAVLRI